MSTDEEQAEANNQLMDEVTKRLETAILTTDRVDVVVMSSINVAVKVLTGATGQSNVQALDTLITTLQALKQDELEGEAATVTTPPAARKPS